MAHTHRPMRGRRLACAFLAWSLSACAVPAARAQGAQEPQLAGSAAGPVPVGQGLSPLQAAQNPFLGGVRAGTVTTSTLPLTLADAIARGLKQNLGLVLGEQGVQSASGARTSALSSLLPNVAARVAPERQTINLAAFGFPLPPGANPLVGPFNVYDARVGVAQTVFDWSAIQASRASAEGVTAAKLSYKDTRDMVVATVATLYLQGVAGASLIDAVAAQVKTAQALYDRAVSLKASGVVPAIEVLRAQVQLQAQQQRLIFYENEFAKRKLALARAIGLPLEQRFDLVDKVPYAALQPMPVDDALKQAYASRSDLQAAQALVRAAEDTRSAAQGQAYPSVRFTADIGKIGPTTDTLLKTYSVAAGVRIPIFQGGEVRGRVQQASAAVAEQRARVEDLRARIDYEVRTALLDLQAAADRVQVAQGSVDLAREQLTQAQDRFSAGVVSNIEVVQAQEAVATAIDNYISSLYAHNVAKIALARALGVGEQDTGRLLGGAK